ncbi:hypothetical protein [[Eubacterium] cellulosolvens]
MDNIKNEPVKLSDLKIFSAAQLEILQQYSITSAEHFVGVCATPEGFKGVMGALGVTETKLNKMLSGVKSRLPPELTELLSKPIEVTPPLGARKPLKKRKAE